MYPEARKERIRSVAEQNEHMISLMQRLKERVTDDDRQQIEDLLERIGAKPSGGRSKPTSKRPDVRESEPGQAESIQVANAPSNSVSLGVESQPPWEFTVNVDTQKLRSLPHEENLIQAQPVKNVLARQPESLPSPMESGSPQFGSSALFETFWNLQRESNEDAESLMQHVQDCGTFDSASIEAWLRNRQSQRIDSPFSQSHSTSASSIDEPELPRTPKLDVGDSLMETSTTPMEVISETTGKVRTMGDHITIATVKRAVEMFFCSTGLLFYIVPKDQQAALFYCAQDCGDTSLPDTAPFMDVLRNSVSLQARARLAEICGMAAIGLLYLRISDEENAPPANLGHYFYSITKQMLDSAMEANPMRAMKVCALLALYNIYVKARVSLAYVELGLGLAQSTGLHDGSQASLDSPELLDYRRTWRTLLTFSGWLAASLGYAPSQPIPTSTLLPTSQDAKEDIVQQELVKVTIIKARIIRAIPDSGIVSDHIIDEFQQELNALNEALPDWMTMSSLLNAQRTTPLRKAVFYFHLFFLSALQLLHRRTMANPTHCSTPTHLNTRTGVREGLIAAKMAARMLALMQEESYIGQFCWMCIYSSYTSGIILLQAAVQKIISGYHSSTWTSDLRLASSCIRVLSFCSRVDSVAARMGETVQHYMNTILSSVPNHSTSLHSPNSDSDLGSDFDTAHEEEVVDYLFHIPPGETTLLKAARDLLRLIRHPFGTTLELMAEGGPRAPIRGGPTVVNWMEAAVGIPSEWDWELKGCGVKGDSGSGHGWQGGDGIGDRNSSESGSGSGRGEVVMRDVVTSLGSGKFLPVGDKGFWEYWTVHSSF